MHLDEVKIGENVVSSVVPTTLTASLKRHLSFYLLILLLTVKSNVSAQTLYSKAFGKSKDPAIVFLHGGPGFNSAGFEATTAQSLADAGFYVIVYDRRGEGRSTDKLAAFTFTQTFDDIMKIYKHYGIKRATLIGHSFGGIVATLFTEAYPDQVNTIILASAPVSLQETFRTIIKSAKQLYQTRKDSINLRYITILGAMDTTSIEYGSYCFAHALQNGFYTPKQPTESAKSIYKTFGTDSLLLKYGRQASYEAPQGFWKNEHYTTINLSASLKKLTSVKIPIYGIYGKDDGLYSSSQIADLQHVLGTDHLLYLDHCSHNVFIDQQAAFIKAIKSWAK